MCLIRFYHILDFQRVAIVLEHLSCIFVYLFVLTMPLVAVMAPTLLQDDTAHLLGAIGFC